MAHKICFSLQITKRTLSSPSHQFRRVSSYFQPSESEYFDGPPVYPPILDLSPEAVWDRTVENRAEQFKYLPTVEEKLIELNKPRYYGWWSCQLTEFKIPYNGLPFIQFATRSCMSSGLPPAYKDLEVAAEKFLPIIKGPLSDLILQEFSCTEPRYILKTIFNSVIDSQFGNLLYFQ